MKVASLYEGKALFLFTLLKKYTGILAGPASVKSTIQVLQESDVIIDIRGIIYPGSAPRKSWRRLFGGALRGFSAGLNEALRFASTRILHKPVIKYTSSLGPFSLKWSRIFARLYFGRFIDLILARENASLCEINKLGIKTPVLTVPDTAFLLPASESKESQRYASLPQTGPLIGISVSFQPRNRAPASVDYCQIMADLANYLIAKHQAYVVLIPNQLEKGSNDDRLVAEAILAKVKSNHCDIMNTDNLLAQEVKGLIGQFEVIVAARYHTIIAALSLGIPVLAIAWHHKYDGALGLFNQENRVCNIKELTSDDLVERFEALWNDREQIRKTIMASLPDVQDRITRGARAVYDIVSVKCS